MSENKRSRKYNNLKEIKRTILLSKRDDRENDNGQTSQNAEGPKILLKPKEKLPTAVQQSVPIISIAIREPTNSQPASSSSSSSVPLIPSNKHNLLTGSAFASVGPKESKDLHTSQEAPAVKTPKMLGSLPLVTDHYQIDNAPLNFLLESNAHFLVIGVIGTQGTGKSTLLNMLSTDRDSAKSHSNEYSFEGKKSIFSNKRNSENAFSSVPTTEGIHMYITADRTILLDCSPVLCNPYKKDYVLNEMDDLRMVIFMLSVCQMLLVVEEDPFNISLLRLLCCADMMKPNVDKEKTPSATDGVLSNAGDEHSPGIMFVHNMADQRQFMPSSIERLQTAYKSCLKNSKLRIFTDNQMPAIKSNHSQTLSHEFEDPGMEVRRLDNRQFVNIFTFPRIAPKGAPSNLSTHTDLKTIVNCFRQRVFMAPRQPFSGSKPFTEKNWSQLVLATWESHKNNYFLRKYESELTSRSTQ